MAQRSSTLSSRQWLKQQKYWRVEQKVGAVHLAIEDRAIDGYRTFGGKTIGAGALKVAKVVECYSGDECADCRQNIDVWVKSLTQEVRRSLRELAWWTR